MQCLICRNENEQDARFCSECGYPLYNRHNQEPEDSIDGYSTNILSGTMDEDFEEARQALEIKRKMDEIKRWKLEGLQEIKNRAKLAEAKAQALKINAREGGSRRKGELIALDIAKTLRELREQCENDEIFTIILTLETLKKKISDNDSIKHIDLISYTLNNSYDPFSHLNDNIKKQIRAMCKYIEDSYCTDLIRGEDDEDNADNVVVTGEGNVVATEGGTAISRVNIRK